jgi:hypothetical protein
MLLTKYQNTDSVPGPEADLIGFLVSQRLRGKKATGGH